MLRSQGVLRDLIDLLRTPLGRQHLLRPIWRALVPLRQLRAGLRRRTFARAVSITAVTGSFGKTTAATAASVALGIPVSRRIAANSSGAVARIIRTLPADQERAVIEVGINRKGRMAKQARVVLPDCVIVTAIGSEHLDTMGTLETVAREKALLLRAMRPPGLAVLNADDPRVLAMAGSTGARVITYGLNSGADVRASEIRIEWPGGTRFRLEALGEVREMRIRLLGPTMVRPVLAAIALATGQGLGLDEVIDRLEGLDPVPGRLEPVRLPDGAWLLRDDCKSSVETIEAALVVLAEAPGGKILVLNESPEWPDELEETYRALARRLAELCDEVVLVGEGHERLGRLALEAGLPPTSLHPVRGGVLEAIATLRRILRPGDTALLKGRLKHRLERVGLALRGETVGCDLEECWAVYRSSCSDCPMLVCGWGERRVLPPNPWRGA